MASMGVGLRVTSPAVVEGSVKINGSSRLNVTGRVTVPQRSGLVVRAQQSEAAPETTRRSVIGLVAAGLAGGSFVQAVLADAVPIKIGPPPPPSGGLRQITQTKRAVARAKESAKEIVNVKSLIDEKAWPIRIASLSSFFQVYPNKGFVPSLDRCLTKFQPWFVFLFSQGHGKAQWR